MTDKALKTVVVHPAASFTKTASTFLGHVASGLIDSLMFIAVLCFTGVAVVAVAIAAPLALGISAIIGRDSTRRSGWRRAKAG